MADGGKTPADKAAEFYLMSFANNDITQSDFHSGMESGDEYYEDDILQVHPTNQAQGNVNSRRGTVSCRSPSPVSSISEGDLEKLNTADRLKAARQMLKLPAAYDQGKIQTPKGQGQADLEAKDHQVKKDSNETKKDLDIVNPPISKTLGTLIPNASQDSSSAMAANNEAPPTSQALGHALSSPQVQTPQLARTGVSSVTPATQSDNAKGSKNDGTRLKTHSGSNETLIDPN